MKKTFLFAALAALSMVSCTNNELPEAEVGYGYINLNVSNDVTVSTRAGEGEVTVNNLSGWTVTATNTEENSKKYTLTELSNNAVLAATYNVDARTATNMETATTTDSYGIAYYQGEATNVSVNAGQTTTATIACGKAKNSKLTLVNNLNADVFKEVKLHAKKGKDFLVLPSGGNTSIYYNPSAETTVEYYITYKYNTETDVKTLKNEESNFKIKIAQAGTDYQIKLTSTDNGKINLNITYQDFTVSGTDFTFDAATGTGSQNQ